MQILQLPLPHETLPRSALPVNFNFEQINLLRNEFELWKATRGGLGKTHLSIGDFCSCWCTFFNTLKTMCNVKWKVNTYHMFFQECWWFPLEFFSGVLIIPRTPRKGSSPSLYFFSTSACLWTLRHLFVDMHLKWLPYVFNNSPCNY